MGHVYRVIFRDRYSDQVGYKFGRRCVTCNYSPVPCLASCVMTMFWVPNRAITGTNLTSSSRAKKAFEKVSIEDFSMLNYINPTQRMRLIKSTCVSFAALLAEAFHGKS